MNEPELVLNDSIPKYLQLKNVLVEKIESGEITRGSKILSERNLSELYSVSRMTARNAILALEKEGYIYKQGTKGAIVAKTKTNKDMLHVESFTSYAHSIGIEELKSDVLACRLEKCSKIIAEKLELTEGENCYYLERLRIGDGIPVAIEKSYINTANTEEFLKHDFRTESLWAFFSNKKITKPAHVKSSVELVHLTRAQCSMLGLDEGDSGLRVITQVVNYCGDIVEYCESIYQADYYSFSYEVDVS